MISSRRLRALLAVSFVLLGATLASAQTISVRTLALRTGEMPAMFLKGTKNHIPLRFSAIQPARAVRALYANPLPLYRSETDDEGKRSFVPAQQVKLPSGVKAILLLGWTAGDKIQFVAIKDDFGSARFDDWLLINTTNKPIAFMVGDKAKPVRIAPGTSKTYKITAEKNKGAAVLAQAPVDGKAKTFFSTYWPVHADKRAVVLFVDDGKRIRVKRISDKLGSRTPPTS